MPLDPARVEAIAAWLGRAESDLAAGRHAMSGPRLFPCDAAFHAQQAAEKSLKAFLSWHDVVFSKTHSLAGLGQRCCAVDATLRDVCLKAEPLTEYVVVFRYPPGRDATPLEALAALRIAREVYEAVLLRLPPEVRPAESP